MKVLAVTSLKLMPEFQYKADFDSLSNLLDEGTIVLNFGGMCELFSPKSLG